MTFSKSTRVVLTCHGISKDLTPPIITVVSMRLGVGPKRSFSFGFAKNDFGGCYSTQIFSSNVEKGPISKGKLGGGFKYLLCASLFGEMIQIDYYILRWVETTII